jgi:hypothetical protein
VSGVHSEVRVTIESGPRPEETSEGEWSSWWALHAEQSEADSLEDTLVVTIRSLLERTLFDAARQLALLEHVGPWRHSGRRIYELDDPSTTSVGGDGRGMPQLLHRDPEVLGLVNHALQAMGVGYEVDVAGLQEVTTTAVELGLTRDGVRVGILDVGFGISQMLPVLTQHASQSMKRAGRDRGGMLLLEQPELHLHPKLQWQLASVLAGPFLSDLAPDTRPLGVQVIVETHSEHLVLGLQLLIRDARLDPEVVSLVWVGRDEAGGTPEVSRIELRKDGEFHHAWPEGFFDERLRLVLGEFK